MNSLMRCLEWSGGLCLIVLLAAPAMTLALPQEPVSSPSATPPQDPALKTDKPAKKKYSHTNDFLIRGTVFNDKALSFPGVELRFRAAGQRKYRWQTYTNSRGEFAVRVPQGANYEMLVHVKGFVDQTRAIDAKNGENEETVVFRMQRITGDKK